MDAAVEIEGHIQALSLHRGDAVQHSIKSLGTLQPAQLGSGVHFDGFETLGLAGGCGLGNL